MLLSQAEAEKKKAFLTIDLLANHPSGIGDHSTSDFYNNANEALEALASADDQIEMKRLYIQDLNKNLSILSSEVCSLEESLFMKQEEL